MTEPSPTVVTAWARLMRAQQTALSRVERALKEAGLPSLEWYDILLELERTGADGIRPFTLQQRLLLPQYGLSRVLNRMTKAGLVKQRACEEDGRGHQLHITQAGKTMRREMWRVYGPAIQEAVGSKLTQKDAETLARLLKPLA